LSRIAKRYVLEFFNIIDPVPSLTNVTFVEAN